MFSKEYESGSSSTVLNILFLFSSGSLFSTLLTPCIHPQTVFPITFKIRIKKLSYFFEVSKNLWSYWLCNVHILLWWDIQKNNNFCTLPAFPREKIWQNKRWNSRTMRQHPPDPPLCATCIRSKGKKVGFRAMSNTCPFFLLELAAWLSKCLLRDLGQKIVMCWKDNQPREGHLSGIGKPT